jgi:hypothetical protein
LHTLSHALFHCPVAAAVWGWVAHFWVAVTGGPPPPVALPVVLGGDRAVWDPGGGLSVWQLWVFVRVVALHFLHQAACAPQPDLRCPARVAASVLATLRATILYEWTLVAPPPPGSASVPDSWLRGRTTHMTREAFERRWAIRGVLCCVRSPTSMIVRVHVGNPLPLPPPLTPAPIED